MIAALLLMSPRSCEAPRPTACVPPGTQIEAPRAAGCVVVDRERLLLVRSAVGKWSIPGGLIDPGEDSAAAAVRETWEEARVRVTAGEPVCGVAANRFVAHRCTLQSGTARETEEARFMSREEIRALRPSELRFPDQQADYLRFLDR